LPVEVVVLEVHMAMAAVVVQVACVLQLQQQAVVVH
jgi:hypothetical protein